MGLVGIEIPHELWEKVGEIAAKKGVSRSELVRNIIEARLKVLKSDVFAYNDFLSRLKLMEKELEGKQLVKRNVRMPEYIRRELKSFAALHGFPLYVIVYALVSEQVEKGERR